MSLVMRRNLLADKVQFGISVAGIALAVFLISFLLSLFQGWKFNVGRFVEHVDADVWVARDGTTDFLNAASILPAGMKQELASLPSVESVDALIVRPMNFNVGDGEFDLHLIGYEVDGGAGGPSNIAQGKETPGEHEIIVDRAYLKKAGIRLGDRIESFDQELEVVGVSTGGDFIFSQTAFVSLQGARSFLGMEGLTTFYLLHLGQNADREAVAAEVEERFAGVVAITSEEFAAATRDRIMRNIVPILIVILALAFVVGVAITGLTIYNTTVEKAREFGILKAIGFTNGYLIRLVLEQSLVTGLLGFLIGVGLTIGAAQFVSDLVPQFVTLVRWQDILLVLGTTFMMTVLAALLPVRRITAVDPVAVFKA